MKKVFIYTIIGLVALATGSCSNFLEEQPRSSLTPDFFKTEQGVNYGLTAAYSGLRFQYGPQGAMIITNLGTDETTVGAAYTAGSVCNNYESNLTANSDFQTPWNRNYTYINTCNGIVDFASDNNSDLVAEARFLRAQYYFNLVSTFGGVPLDLGSGELKFSSTPNTESYRNTALEVLLAMEADFKAAAADLPDINPVPGRVGKAAALHFLAKTYLVIGCYYQYDFTNERGSWESPAPADMAKANEYYQLSKTTADLLLNNRSRYGVELLADYADVNRPGNEHNRETILLVEHTKNYTFDESNENTNASMPHDGLKENRANMLFTSAYQDGAPGLIVRTYEYNRPWYRFVGTNHLLNTVFADKVNDTRYYKSFASCYRINSPDLSGKTNANGDPAEKDAPAYYMPGYASRDAAPAEVKAAIDAMAEKGAAIKYTVSYNRTFFPSSTKFTDPGSPDEEVTAGVGSRRPFIVSKLSETILIAAEAAFKTGGAGAAKPYIDELRKRAAQGHTYSFGKNSGNTFAELTIGDDATAEAAMLNYGTITLDFILDERSRELCFEQHRWFDLVRTAQLLPRIQQGLNSCTNGFEDHLYSNLAITNIKRFHHLRPIPQAQIDAMTNPDKANYQNPGYR